MVNEITPTQQAIKRIIETIQKIPQNIVPPDHIGTKKPVSENSLPTIVISAKDIKESSSGIGNFIGIQKDDRDRVFEIKGSRVSGIFQINIWDLSASKVDEILTAINEIITANKNDLKRDGFLYLSLIGETYPSKLSTDPLKEAVIRTIDYQGIFEFVDREICREGTIKEIKVNLDGFFSEKVIIKR
jgi:hypothetical protein